MTEMSPQPAAPPEGQNPIYNRLLRAYAPIAAIALILLLVAALVETAPEMRASGDQEAVVQTDGEAAPADDGAAADTDDDSALARNAAVVLLAAGLLGLVVLAIWFGTRTPSRTASAGGGSSGPGPGFFTVSSRLLRGYGPLAVLMVLVVVMGLAIPTLSPDTDDISAETPDAGDSFFDDSEESADNGDQGTTSETTGGADTTGATQGTTGSTEGTTGGVASGGQGSGIAPVTGVSACGGRAEQIPGDPYSPPCVEWGAGDNGGATTQGVTADKIIVTYRVLDEKGFQQTLAELAGASLSDTPASIQRSISALAEYFNERFQFYGREIEISFYDGRGSNTNELLGKGRDKAQADALVVKDRQAFADLSATSEPYADALASHGVVGFGTPYLSRQWHEARAPFAWSLATDGTLVSELAAEYANKRLYGKPAVYADGPLQGKPRNFAVIAPENSWYQESVDNAKRIIEEAGNPAPMNVQYQLDLSTMSDQANNIIPKLKSNGITTVTCGCDPIMPVFLSGSANRSQYFPEFIIAGTALTDIDIVGQLWHQNFARNAFGISSLMPFVPPEQTIAYAAYRSVRPDEEPAFSVDLIYYQMYMLAIGIQGAGPNLTPQSLSDGLFNYPEKVGPLGLWRFGPGDRTAANDVREIYWDPNAISGVNGKQGAYRGTNDQRWTAGSIPAGDPGVPKG